MIGASSIHTLRIRPLQTPPKIKLLKGFSMKVISDSTDNMIAARHQIQSKVYYCITLK